MTVSPGANQWANLRAGRRDVRGLGREVHRRQRGHRLRSRGVQAAAAAESAGKFDAGRAVGCGAQ